MKLERYYSIKRDRLLIEELEEEYIRRDSNPTPSKFRNRMSFNSVSFNMVVKYFAYTVYPTSEANMKRLLKYGGFYEFWNKVWLDHGNIESLTVGDVMDYCDPYGLISVDEGSSADNIIHNSKTIKSLYLVEDGDTYETKYLYPPKFVEFGSGNSN